MSWGYTSDFEQWKSRIQIDIATLLVNCSCELKANNDQIWLSWGKMSDVDQS